LLWAPEPESKEESDLLWIPESESKGESDLSDLRCVGPQIPSPRSQGGARLALDPRVRVQGGVRFGLDRRVRSGKAFIWSRFIKLGFVWSVAVVEKGAVLMDSAPDVTSLII
jgi:hypothetical protein